MMGFEILLFLLFLNIKHLIADFYLQDNEMVKGKAIYGNVKGISHSLVHFIGTWLVVLIMIHFFVPEIIIGKSFLYIMTFVLGIPLIDFIAHYHIDWIKMKIERDITKKEFWQSLGCDQFLHQATYLFLAILIFI